MLPPGPKTHNFALLNSEVISVRALSPGPDGNEEPKAFGNPFGLLLGVKPNACLSPGPDGNDAEVTERLVSGGFVR